MLIPIFTTHFRDTFSTSTINQVQLSYGPNSCIILFFYYFKHDPSPCNILGKLRECDLEGIGRFLSDFLHEPSLCVLPSEQGILVAPLAHGGGFVLEISTLKEPLFSG